MLRFGFYDVVWTAFVTIMVLSTMLQPSYSIIVSFGTRQGPIEVPQRTARKVVHPIPYRSAPAPVWEVIEDDVPEQHPYHYVLPEPLIKPVIRYNQKQNAYHPGKSAVNFGSKYRPNQKNTLAQQKRDQKFQHKFAKKFAKHSPEKMAYGLQPLLSKEQPNFNDQYNRRNARSSYV